MTSGAPELRPAVLVVEDDDDIREALVELLLEAGYEATGAPNGEEALRAARAARPAVILLDLMMPVMTGWQFRDAQRKDPDLAGIPVIVLSASGIKEIEAERLLKKPVHLREVITAVREAIAGAHA